MTSEQAKKVVEIDAQAASPESQEASAAIAKSVWAKFSIWGLFDGEVRSVMTYDGFEAALTEALSLANARIAKCARNAASLRNQLQRKDLEIAALSYINESACKRSGEQDGGVGK